MQLNSLEICEKKEDVIISRQKKKLNIDNDFFAKVITYFLYIIALPIIVILGYVLSGNQKYNLLSLFVIVIALIPMFFAFEKGNNTAREIVIIAVMTAISCVGRLVFAPLPGFKPITAIVIITGISFGMRAGFITGAMTAFVSNFFYGQGPWTPFQMFSFGFIGLLSALLFNPNKKINVILLVLVGIIGGVLFSLMMDIYTTLSVDNYFTFERYLFFVTASLPFMAIYVVSNVIFLLLITKPLITKLNRLRNMYGVFKSRW